MAKAYAYLCLHFWRWLIQLTDPSTCYTIIEVIYIDDKHKWT